MAKNIRRMFAMVLVMCMIVSALPVQALAAEGETTITKTDNWNITLIFSLKVLKPVPSNIG